MTRGQGSPLDKAHFDRSAKDSHIYFQLSPFNSSGLLNPRSCVRTVIGTDLSLFFFFFAFFFSSLSRYRRCVSCLFVYSLPSVAHARVFFPPYFVFPVNETLSLAITARYPLHFSVFFFFLFPPSVSPFVITEGPLYLAAINSDIRRLIQGTKEDGGEP